MLAAAAGGVLLALAFPPVGVGPLAVLAVALLALAVRGGSVRGGALSGLMFGLAFFVPLLQWSGTYVGPLPWLILAGSQAAFLALLGGAAALTQRLALWPLWTATLWVAEEALRSRLPYGGFPWGRLAFSQVDTPLAWLAASGGAPLVGFAVALLGGLLAAVLAAVPGTLPARRTGPLAGLPGRRQQANRFAASQLTAGGVLALMLAAGLGVTVASAAAQPARDSARTATTTVAVVQGNVPRLGLDFSAQREAVLDNHVARTLQLAAAVRAGRLPRPALVVWPENASDVDPLATASARAQINRAAAAVDVPILVGALLLGPGPDHVTNAGIVWDPRTGPGQRYVKRHPVPFGEYVPLRSIARLVSNDVDRVARDMVAGSRPGVLRVGPATVGDVICFEVAYDGLVRDVVRGGSQLLVVQTNNATFGRGGETWQQLAMSRLRAVEHDRTVLVAATSGVSAIIGPDGRVVDRSAVFTPDLLVATVPLRGGTTLATRLGALPEWLLVMVAAGALAAALVARRRSGAAVDSAGDPAGDQVLDGTTDGTMDGVDAGHSGIVNTVGMPDQPDGKTKESA